MPHALRLVLTACAFAPLVAVLALTGSFRVRGRTWVVARHRERLLLLALELALVALWAAGLFGLHRDAPLVPPAAEAAAGTAGAALALAGGLLALWARLRLGRHFSPTFGVMRDHELATDGPYAVTRHPLYTGMLGLVAGGALLWNSALTLALAAALVLPLWLHTIVEERLFVTHFGEAFVVWRRRVPRLLPLPRPRRPLSSTPSRRR